MNHLIYHTGYLIFQVTSKQLILKQNKWKMEFFKILTK